jgi:hypothetical protein
MPGEESRNKGKNPSKSKKGGSKSKKSQKGPKRPPKSKKGTKTDSPEEKEQEVPDSKEEEPGSKGTEKEDQEPSKSEEEAKPGNSVEEGQKPPESEEDRLKIFITAYIDSYMDYVEEQNIKEGDFPLLYAYYPLDVTGYILPDESTCFLFKGLAAATKITIEKADFSAVDSEITDKRYDYISCYPASFSYTREEAEKQAKNDVDGDIAHSKQLGTVQAERAAKDETLKSIRLLSVGMPWIAQRKEGGGSLKFPQGKDADELSTDALGMKEDEFFSDFSDRVHTLESALLYGTKISTEPPEDEEVKEETEEAKPAPPPAIEPVVPVAAAAAAPGTHVTVEIKQPEAPGKGEIYNERTEEDILRLKKTLYIQSRDIEELRRVNEELGGKLGNLEQMRQTVFRVNRKVFDTDAKIARLEKSNMDILRKFAELRSEQAEQNKKMRRFIAERAKKARNQALALAGIALGVGMAALALLILDIDIKSLLGI